MNPSDPFSSAPDAASALRDRLCQSGVPFPVGRGPVALDLGADPRCAAGIELARTDFERVVGGFRLLLRAMDEPWGYLCAGTCFSEPFRLLKKLLGRQSAIRPLRYRLREYETAQLALARCLGEVRTVTAEHCRAAFRAVYEEAPFTDRLISVCYDGGMAFVRAPFEASCQWVLQQLTDDYPTPARIVAGDLLTGCAISQMDEPLSPQTDALQLLTAHELGRPAPCIRCGACRAACEAQLPLWRLATGRSIDLTNCTLCGVCTLVCPAHLPLAAQIQEKKQEATV